MTNRDEAMVRAGDGETREQDSAGEDQSRDQAPLIKVKWVCKRFRLKPRLFGRTIADFFAVNGVSLDIMPGEALGLVGESGSGKTTLARMIIGLERPSEGEIHYRNRRIDGLGGRHLLRVRRNMQMIFQDPFASLNPRMTVKKLLLEPLLIHRTGLTRAGRREKMRAVLEDVGADRDWLGRYPHQLSGGQRQRVAIARALILDPEFIIADEPVSALDVSVQAQVLNVLLRARQKTGLTYLFISHDLAVIEHIATRVAVMYRGKICEIAPREELFSNPQHPYTQLLLSGVPKIGGDTFRRSLKFMPSSSVIEHQYGCPFYARCPKALPHCRQSAPRLSQFKDQHQVACYAVDCQKPKLPQRSSENE